MPRKIVVLDTNLYRALSPAAVQELRDAERRASFMAVASFHSVLELGAHLGDPSDPVLPHCRAALRKLHAHTRLYDGSREYVPFSGNREAILARTLFGRDLGSTAHLAEAYGGFLGTVAKLEGPIPDELQPTLAAMHDRAERVKADFVAQAVRWTEAMSGGRQSWNPLEGQPKLRQEFLRALDGGDGIQLLAESIASRIASSVQIELSDDALTNAASVVRRTCGVALHFYSLLVRKVVESGFNLSKRSRRTAVWDYYFAFQAGATALSYDVPVQLVTNDRLLHEAAQHAQHPATVLSLEEYRAQLRLE